uniref:DNA replication checkpoint mediator MRC1 domain-containing protein n=1 Tax=Dunaliella tertiolecta TaxID=3047 RepID=A0A7S3QQL3_DUNTE
MAKAHAKAAAERRARALAAGQSRFVDMEAELSEDEEGVAAASEDEDERGGDGELADLIGTAKEGARDARVRTMLHKQWQEEQDNKDVQQLLQGIQNGFRRPRNGLGDLDDEMEGTDAEARRRRAQLFGGSALDEDEGNGAALMDEMGMRMVLDVGDAEAQEANTIDMAAVYKRELRKKYMAAGHTREEAMALAAHSNLSAEGFAAMRSRHAAGGSQGEEGEEGGKRAVQEPLSFAGALPKGKDLLQADIQLPLRLSADPLPILHNGTPVWQNLEEQEEGGVHEVRSLLSRSKSNPKPESSAAAAAPAAVDTREQTKPGQPSTARSHHNPVHIGSKPPKAGAKQGGLPAPAGMRFSMFGRDISNKKGGSGGDVPLGQPSFLGRAASAVSHRTTASNTGARSFVFGSDLSNSHAAGNTAGGDSSSKGGDQAPGGNGAAGGGAAKAAGAPSFAGVRGMVGVQHQQPSYKVSGSGGAAAAAARMQPPSAKQNRASLIDLLGSSSAGGGAGKGADRAKVNLSEGMQKIVAKARVGAGK